MKRTTPYEALLAEIGLFSIFDAVSHKKLRLFYDLSKSDDTRVSKRILM